MDAAKEVTRSLDGDMRLDAHELDAIVVAVEMMVGDIGSGGGAESDASVKEETAAGEAFVAAGGQGPK